MAAIGVGPNQSNLNRDFLISKPNDGLRGPNLVPNLTPAQKRVLARRDEIVANLKAQGGRRQQRDTDLEELQVREEVRMTREAAEKAAREEAERTAREITNEDRELLSAALDELASEYKTWEEFTILHQAVGYLTPLQLREYTINNAPQFVSASENPEKHRRYSAFYALQKYTNARENEASSDPTMDVSTAVLTLEDALEVLSTRYSCPSMNAWGWRTGGSLDTALRQTFEYLGLNSKPTKLDEEVLKRAILQLWPDLVEMPKYALIKRMYPEEFGKWLEEQAHRIDSVGDLARFTRECYFWPRGKGRLKPLEAELKRYTSEHVQGLQEAWSEYELYRTMHAL